MTANPQPAMLTVNDGPRGCVGFVLNRFRDGFQAYDIDGKSIGIYPSVRAAAAAVSAEAAP
jgi:hypothetical protein